MAPKRPSPPPLRCSTPSREDTEASRMEFTPSTPGLSMLRTGDIMSGVAGVTMPPSPFFPDQGPAQLTLGEPASTEQPRQKEKSDAILRARTGAGIKKPQPKAKGTAARASSEVSGKVLEKPFRFLELPGEVRNMIYGYTCDNQKQALLVHRPRLASLRHRTRLDRSRTLLSDVKDRELKKELATVEHSKKTSSGKKAAAKDLLTRDNNRPFFGLTQVCRQLRGEYRPIYLRNQEMGMDLVDTVEYLKTFYYDAPEEFKKLYNSSQSGPRRVDLPFMGNLTIALGDKVTKKESSVRGVEILPLLDLWANSYKLEAGFGRYVKNRYIPEFDGEAKDLYRLFGRRVLRNRKCSPMNDRWRKILRSCVLASITVHRKPPNLSAIANLSVISTANRPRPTALAIEPKPYILILFRREFAETWMFPSLRWYTVPLASPQWLRAHGFDEMEYFDVKVGCLR